MTPAEVRWQRFVDKIDRRNACWLWPGVKDRHGYGMFFTFPSAHKYEFAHRYSYTLANGPIPAGMKVCHHCDRPACIRPTHLFVGTQADNIRDMDAKGRRHRPRGLRGSESPHAKLTWETIARMRRLRDAGATYTELGRMVGVHKGTVRNALQGLTWSEQP